MIADQNERYGQEWELIKAPRWRVLTDDWRLQQACFEWPRSVNSDGLDDVDVRLIIRELADDLKFTLRWDLSDLPDSGLTGGEIVMPSGDLSLKPSEVVKMSFYLSSPLEQRPLCCTATVRKNVRYRDNSLEGVVHTCWFLVWTDRSNVADTRSGLEDQLSDSSSQGRGGDTSCCSSQAGHPDVKAAQESERGTTR